MLSVSSRIWTLITVSISCDDNHYTTGTCLLHHEHLHYSHKKTGHIGLTISCLFARMRLSVGDNIFKRNKKP